VRLVFEVAITYVIAGFNYVFKCNNHICDIECSADCTVRPSEKSARESTPVEVQGAVSVVGGEFRLVIGAIIQ